MVMKKSGRGAVGRAFHSRERYDNDEEFRERRKKSWRKYDKKNRKKLRKYHKEWERELSKFAGKKCKKCNKILNYKTKGEYCHKHIWIGRKKK